MKQMILIALLLTAMSASFAQTPTKTNTMPGMPDAHTTASAPAVAPLTVTAVYPGYNSVKVSFTAVPGAADYRVYEQANPGTVKYAGIVHPYDARLFNPPNPLPSLPATEIEWNGLTPGKPTVLVVEAVDALGPFPSGNLYDVNNLPLNTTQMGEMSMAGMLGANSGATGDGLISINGQGAATNTPHVIARSLPFTVTASAPLPIPSGSDAAQVLSDPIDAIASKVPGASDPTGSLVSYTLTSGRGVAYDLGIKDADNVNTMVMVGKSHLMDVLFDGPNPSSGGNVKHNNHSLVFLSPQQTFDISSGRILHVVEMADAHTDSRRWVGVSFAPADDPLQNWYSQSANVNKTSRAVFFQVFNNKYDLSEFTGPDPANAALSLSVPIYGSLFQSPHWGRRSSANGIALDNRSRFDLFVSQTHFREYEDGVLGGDIDFPSPLTWSQVKIYWTHYLYHTGNEIDEVTHNTPYETVWRDLVPYSDERHWGSFGAEVLPATTAWASLDSRVALPAATAPVFVSVAPPVGTPPVVVPPVTTPPVIDWQSIAISERQALQNAVDTLQKAIAAVPAK